MLAGVLIDDYGLSEDERMVIRDALNLYWSLSIGDFSVLSTNLDVIMTQGLIEKNSKRNAIQGLIKKADMVLWSQRERWSFSNLFDPLRGSLHGRMAWRLQNRLEQVEEDSRNICSKPFMETDNDRNCNRPEDDDEDQRQES